MATFTLGSDGQLRMAEHTKYGGKTVDEVARLDPNYLRWARDEGLVGCPEPFFEKVEQAMVRNGVPFKKPQGAKKKLPTRQKIRHS
jgi:hypothetical protein